MYIERHPVDVSFLRMFFEEESAKVRDDVASARTDRDSRWLSFLASNAEFAYISGSVVAPDSPEVAQAIRLAAQAHTAILLFARIEDPPRYCHIGDGPPITFTNAVDESLVHPGRWLQAFDQALISRQAEILAALRDIPTELFEMSSTRSEEGMYTYVEMHRAMLTEEHFTNHWAFREQEADYLGRLERGEVSKATRMLAGPVDRVLRALDRGDVNGFNEALTEAVQLHKKYWSATKARRRNMEGYVSLHLTAAAALAWDRGLRFNLESDYLPTSWVRGDLFREPNKGSDRTAG